MANPLKEKITDALTKLDPANPEHWTDDGLPVTKVVQTLASDLNIKRSDITEVAPGFARDSVQTADAPVVDPNVDPVTGVKTIPAVSAEEETGDPTEARATLEAAQAAVEVAAENLRSAQTAHVNAVRAKDRALLTFNRKFPPLDAATNIQQHLATQQRLREENAEKFGAPNISRQRHGNARMKGMNINSPGGAKYVNDSGRVSVRLPSETATV